MTNKSNSRASFDGYINVIYCLVFCVRIREAYFFIFYIAAFYTTAISKTGGELAGPNFPGCCFVDSSTVLQDHTIIVPRRFHGHHAIAHIFRDGFRQSCFGVTKSAVALISVFPEIVTFLPNQMAAR